MKKYSFVLWACLTVCPFFLQGQKVDSVRVVDPRTFPNDTTIVDTDETYGRPTGSNKRYQMKYIRKYVREGFSGVISVNPVSGVVSLQNSSIGWAKLDNAVKDSINTVAWNNLSTAVKDSIRLSKKDTSVTLNGDEITLNTSFDDTRKFSNVVFIAKGSTGDTAKITFSALPEFEQLGTVFFVKTEGVAAISFASAGTGFRTYYSLKSGQRAEVRAVYDATLDDVVWGVWIVSEDAYFNSGVTSSGFLYVAPWGNNSFPGVGGIYRPYATIEAAVAAAVSGNTIYVFSGTYNPVSNLWKNGVNFYFEDCKVGATFTASEGFFSSEIFRTVADNEKMKIRGNLKTYQILKIQHKNIIFDAEGALIGQTFFAPGANNSKVTIKAHETPCAFYEFHNTADTVTRNTFSMIADVWVPYVEGGTTFLPIAYFNNTSTRAKLNNYSIQIGSVHMTAWGDYSNRGIVQCRGVGMAFDSTFIRLDIGKGVFDLVGVNTANFGLLAFFPFQPSTGNQFYFNCDDCLLKNRAVLANGNVMPETTDLTVISGNFRSYNKLDPFFVSGGSGNTTNRFVFDGNFYCHDSTLFILSQRANWEFTGTFKTRENDDPIIVANWASTGSTPIIRNAIFDTPTTTQVQSSTSTTWYTAGARSMTTITKDADITFAQLPTYDPIPTTTGTARVIPYMNTGGRLYTGNNYFKADTNTTSGGQARLRILINNPNGDIGEGDTYSSLSVRTGDALGTEAIANFGDQAVTQATTGYDAIFQTYRSGGNFTSKSNLANGVTTGKFQFRGQVNGASRVLGNIYNVYTGDGTTINSNMFGTTAVAGSIVAGWKLDETSRFWLGANADDYYFPTISPTLVNGRIYSQEWATTGVASVPAWKEIQYAVFSGTTDASGDIAPTFAVMAGQTYAAVVTVEGTTAYQVTVHSKAQNTFKARIYDAGTGAAVGAGVNVTISYILKLP